MRPRLGKSEVADTQTEIVKAPVPTHKESYVTDDDQSRSSSRQSSISLNGHPHILTKEKSLGRPPMPRKTLQALLKPPPLKDSTCAPEQERMVLVDDGTTSIMTAESDFEVKIDDDNDQPKVKEDIAVNRLKAVRNHAMKTVSLIDCATEDSSVVSEKRSMLGRNRSRKETEISEQVKASVSMPSACLLPSESLQLQRQPMNVAKNAVDEVSKKLIIECKSEIPLDEHRGVPEFLFPDNRLEHVSSDLTFSSNPIHSQNLSKSSPYDNRSSNRAPETGQEIRRQQNHTPASPVVEALQFARSQAGKMKTRNNEEDVGFHRSDTARDLEGDPGLHHFGNFRSMNGQLTCGMDGMMKMFEPEWNDGDEFGKGKRHNHLWDEGKTVADAAKSLRAHFACGTFNDVMKGVDPQWYGNQQLAHEAEQGNENRASNPLELPDVTDNKTVSAIRSLRALRSQLICGTIDTVVSDADCRWRQLDPNQNTCNRIQEEQSNDGIQSAKLPTETVQREFQSTDDRDSSSKEDADFRKQRHGDVQNVQMMSNERGPEMPHVEINKSEQYEARALDALPEATTCAQKETIDGEFRKDADSSEDLPTSTFNILDARENARKGNYTKPVHTQKARNMTDELQMMFSHFSGDTEKINNHSEGNSNALHFNTLLRRVFDLDTEATLDDQAKSAEKGVEVELESDARAVTALDENVEMRENPLARVQEQIELDDEAEISVQEQANPSAEDEEQSTCVSVLRRSKGSKTSILKGMNKVSGVQLVLSESSTLELPKHKRNSVIRFAAVPAEIAYEQALQEEEVEAERQKAKKQIQLAKRAVISNQNVDSLDPCFRIFDPALDACDKFCTRSPSFESDDECSIASASLGGDRPRLNLRQRAFNCMKDTPVWPRQRTRKVKSISRLA